MSSCTATPHTHTFNVVPETVLIVFAACATHPPVIQSPVLEYYFLLYIGHARPGQAVAGGPEKEGLVGGHQVAAMLYMVFIKWKCQFCSGAKTHTHTN